MIDETRISDILKNMRNIALLLILSVASVAQNYRAQRTSDHGIPVRRLTDVAQGVEVSIAPAMGGD